MTFKRNEVLHISVDFSAKRKLTFFVHKNFDKKRFSWIEERITRVQCKSLKSLKSLSKLLLCLHNKTL